MAINNFTCRAFFALNLPSDLKLHIAKLSKKLATSAKYKKFKWVEAENLHITLRFLGNINQIQQNCITEKVKSALSISKPFQVTFAALDYFPSSSHPHILSLQPKPTNLLTEVALVLDREVCACDLPTEKKPFLPHLTLAKFNDQHLPSLDKIHIPHFEFIVTNVQLFKSEHINGKSKYTVLESFRLGANI